MYLRKYVLIHMFPLLSHIFQHSRTSQPRPPHPLLRPSVCRSLLILSFGATFSTVACVCGRGGGWRGNEDVEELLAPCCVMLHRCVVCMCVCMHVCMRVCCMYVCVCMCVCVCVYVWMYVCSYVYMCVCMYVCMYLSKCCSGCAAVTLFKHTRKYGAVCYSVLQCATVCCSV